MLSDENRELLQIIHDNKPGSIADLEQMTGRKASDNVNLLLRSDLMTRIECYVKTSGLKPKDAAARLGVTQPHLNDLLKGKIEKFSLDALVNMLGRAGMRVELSVKKAA